jgi:hypothetical protein
MGKAKKKFINALKIPRYKKFRDDADRALEQILINRQIEISREAALLFDAWTRSILMDISIAQHRINLVSVYEKLTRENEDSAKKLASIFTRTKRVAFVLSLSAESEAIAQVKGTAQAKPSQRLFDVSNTPRLAPLASFESRIKYLLDKLARKVIDGVQLGIIQGETLSEIKRRIEKILPERKPAPKVPRVLTKLAEATGMSGRGDLSTRQFKKDLSTNFIDDGTWDDMVDAYKKAYVPEFRSDPRRMYTSEASDEKIAAWELENELTEDFIGAVRDGQVESFEQNGVDDSVWIAIVDSHTDDCCLWRDGLLSSEIEKELQGNHSDDESDAIVAPAHIKCRCRAAPSLEVNNNEELPSNAMEFSEWLEN